MNLGFEPAGKTGSAECADEFIKRIAINKEHKITSYLDAQVIVFKYGSLPNCNLLMR